MALGLALFSFVYLVLPKPAPVHLNNLVTISDHTSTKVQTVQAKANESVIATKPLQEPSPQPPKVEVTATEPEQPQQIKAAVVQETVPAQPETNRAIGQEMAAARGWTGDQWNCLERLWTHESNWNSAAYNRSSGATGIPQSLPARKMASHGEDYLSNPRTQIAWGLDYISNRYSSPCEAWYSWNSRSPSWY